MPCLNHPLADAGLTECWVCGQTFCPECLAELQGHMMCAPCKAEAVSRLEQGDYGNCFDCGAEIAEKRLRALPFAVRCKDCEEAREVAEQRERQMAARRGTSSLFLDM